MAFAIEIRYRARTVITVSTVTAVQQGHLVKMLGLVDYSSSREGSSSGEGSSQPLCSLPETDGHVLAIQACECVTTASGAPTVDMVDQSGAAEERLSCSTSSLWGAIRQRSCVTCAHFMWFTPRLSCSRAYASTYSSGDFSCTDISSRECQSVLLCFFVLHRHKRKLQSRST